MGTKSLWWGVFLVTIMVEPQSAAQPHTAACSLLSRWDGRGNWKDWVGKPVGWYEDSSIGKATHSLRCSSITPCVSCHWSSLLTGGELWETEKVWTLCKFWTLCTAQIQNRLPYYPLWRKLVLSQSNPVHRCVCQQGMLHFRSGSKDCSVNDIWNICRNNTINVW